MNRIYRLVFNPLLGIVQVVAESARTRGKGRGGRRTATRRRQRNCLCLAVAASLGTLVPPAVAATVVVATAGTQTLTGTVTGTSGGTGGDWNSPGTGAGSGAYGSNGRTGADGGVGGAGGSTATHGYGSGGSGNDSFKYYGSGGGGGGPGVSLGSNATLTVNSGSTLTGGAGGAGSGGGGGGSGVFAGSGSTINNSGTITGGTGGLSRSGSSSGGGGSGVSGAGFTLNNSGAIGAGSGGSGNVGVESTGGSTVVNSGTISGTNGTAIRFSGGGNTLVIENGSTINGNVVSSSGSTNGGDTLALGGASNSSFAVSDIGASATYRGFTNFAKTGSSTWTLTGSTSATTSWNVTGGALAISSDGSLGDSSGTLTLNGGALQTTSTLASARSLTLGAANGTLSTDSGTTLTWNGAVSGSGGLTKAGSGTLTLTGANTYSGATSVARGTLALADGASLASAVTIASGATLASGTATISNDLSNGGTLDLDKSGSPYPTLRVNGNYTQSSDGTLRIGAYDATSGGYSRLSLGGTATLGGSLFVDVSSGSPLTAGSTLSSIISASSISRTFTSVSDNSTLFNFSANYTATTVGLSVVSAASTGGISASSAVRASGNALGTGAAQVLDQIFAAHPTGSISTLFQGITGGTTAVANAVRQTLPPTNGTTTSAQNTLSIINRVVQARQEANGGLSSGDDFYGDKNFWMKPFGSWADQSDRDGVSGYQARTAGAVFGADLGLSSASRLGMALAYARAKVTGNSNVAPNNATIDLFQLIGYGSYSLDADTEVNYQIDAGNNRNQGSRSIEFADLTASSNYDSLTAHAGIGIGRKYPLDELTTFTPSLRVDYTTIRDQAYSETGAGALNLKVDAKTTDALVFSADAKLSHKLSEETTLMGNLGIGYNAKASEASTTAAYAGDPGLSFTTTGPRAEPWLTRAGVGVVSSIKNGPEITARYDAEFCSGFNNQSISAKLRWSF